MTTIQRPTQIAAFYHFGPVPPKDSHLNIEQLRVTLEESGQALGLKGLVIFATEGLNGTICGDARETVETWLASTSKTLGFPLISARWSEASEAPFKRFGVRIRPEIVTLGKPEVQPLPPGSPTHLSPDQWDEMLTSGEAVAIDTRNWYETRIGTFRGALDPKIEEFSDFTDYVVKARASGEIPAGKKVMIFCTGGIRCEKAIVDMHNVGVTDVYQLDGGILNYLSEKPHANFEGECFVFDQRVAVDQELKPTVQYKLCPHCGQPADQQVECVRCDTPAQICVTCLAKEAAYKTCSKNCANHFRLAPGRKGKPQHFRRGSLIPAVPRTRATR